MADASEVRYARAGDGTYLAYRVLGRGGPVVLVLQGFFLSIDAIEDEPRWAAFDRRLAGVGRVVRYDVRGVGLSDRTAGNAGLDIRVGDALAVLDALGADRAVVVGTDGGSITALALAIDHADRVSDLIIVNGYARLERSDDYPIGVPSYLLDGFVENVTDPGTADPIDDVSLTAPSLVDDVRFRRWWQRASSRAAAPAAARDVLRSTIRTDLRAGLPRIMVPTLVVHRRDDGFVRVGHGRYLAEHIASSRYVELDGADHVSWAGDADAILAEVEAFLGASSGASVGRRVATILYTDVVSSTEEAARVGNRQWRERLDAHDASARAEVERYGGRVVKFIGDGMLAEFTTPSDAILAACALRDAADDLGFVLRAGLHAGEVDVRGDDLGGLALAIGARVQAYADAGEILASSTVVDLLVGSGIEFTDRGEHDLKGVPGRWRLFAVGTGATGSPGG
ncbi:MAG: adenylate/guanylate cyclase domain-containing protein [Acidimicrobiia bacterium]